ncbi:hypothetical protein M436DRAFT_42837 [Aureobasidium namibiae CBS 147.97]|uniref:Meiotically up-regulated gene 190 protein n=1 Tax=Aureobasidium namibiae CBS 147.97 TaxID=1043004 RepID=A0A074XKD1_9PEZI|nr:uncharacterized protein M436DRAFT_42837 [Aureobasidium namibiae CBS 147.97]KEQ75011.1 hypothetical protein M436DRAFT_42837 [Aureobasidium namibiae CBS 147.97]
MTVQDEDLERRRYKAPYSTHRPIPTIQKYQQEKEKRQENAKGGAPPPKGHEDEKEDRDSANRYLYSREHSNAGSDNSDLDNPAHEKKDHSHRFKKKLVGGGAHDAADLMHDTSEAPVQDQDPKTRRKAIGKSKRKGERAYREVTDPVTHLPVRIHDLQPGDLKRVPENLGPPGSETRSATGLANKRKSQDILADETQEIGRHHAALENLFPPPDFDEIRNRMNKIQKLGIAIGVVAVFVAIGLYKTIGAFFFDRNDAHAGVSWSFLWPYLSSGFATIMLVVLTVAVMFWIHKWTDRQVHRLWEEEIWHADKHSAKSQDGKEETTQWLNNMLTSLWPLVNPDLFISLADTVEDVMQASLPSIVRMVSIEDIGQGSESMRILGVRWLPTGAAARSVGADGKLSPEAQDSHNDRNVPGDQEEADDKQIAEGMEAEEGDFINLEVAFAYRTRSTSKKFKDRAKHAHLYISFYLPGNIKIPVYVDLRGFVGIMRCRLQLTPDPPFFALCTFTLLGQPNVDVACTPLTRKGLNIMNLPVISHFVQTAVDAAVAEYVAPKSMTINLQDMIAGEDFKKDTRAKGVIVVKVKRAFDFKEGDPAIPLVREGSADPYVTVGWAKFVKPLWSTRVILSEMNPHWDETAFILVTADELDVDERLRVQLWDSDRFTADDDLGRIEMDLKELIHNKETRGKMSDRIDGFKALHAGEGLPGKLEWSVGYFPKAHIIEEQLKRQTERPEIRSRDALEKMVEESAGRKLREAKKDESRETEQLKLQQYKEVEDAMIISAPPLHDYPSGILAIQIHEATGLEVRAHHNAARYNDDPEPSGIEEQGDELPSCYCNIVLNHQKIYRTRVKPKNAKPFFNAGTERFIRDWRTAEVYVVVRDARVHEDDPVMGIVRLPLIDIMKKRSQVNGTYPLYGGVGYGRIRVSMVFRSVESQLPKELLGWDWGTLVVDPRITSGSNFPSDLQGCRIKIQTAISVAHMKAHKDENAWASRHNNGVHLGVRRRYASCLIIQFRKDTALRDKTAAFAVLWLCDIPDNEQISLTLPVWKGDLKRATTCKLESYGDKVGELNLKLKFCRGLSRYHKKVAKHDKHLSDVFEVVETARFQMTNSEQNDPGAVKNKNISNDESDDSSSSSGSDSDSSTSTESPNKLSRIKKRLGSRNVVDSYQEYREHSKQINRRHRGVMQFKSARTMWWMKHKAEHLQDRISGIFEHHERTTGIESEA